MRNVDLIKKFDWQCIQETVDEFSLATGTVSIIMDIYGQVLVSSATVTDADVRVLEYIRWNTQLVGTSAELLNGIWMGKSIIKIGKDKIGEWVIGQSDAPVLGSVGMPGSYFYSAMRMLPIIVSLIERQMTDRIQINTAKKNLEEKEAELLNERTYLNALMDNLPSLIFFKDRQSRFLRNSKSQIEFFNCDRPDDLIGKTDFDFCSEANAKSSMLDEDNVIKNGITVSKEEHCIQKDGSYVWLSTIKAPLVDGYGNIIGTVGISNDITDIVVSRFKLEQNEIRFRSIVENLGEGVGIIDDNYVFDFCNHAAESIVGVDEGGLNDRSIFDFMDIKQQARLRKNYAEWARNELNTIEVIIDRVNGQKCSLLVTSAPRVNEFGERDGAYCVFRDISELKKNEEIIKHQNEELHSLNQQKDQIISIIAHDLRSPFYAFLGLTDVLNKNVSTMPLEELKTVISTIRNSAIQTFNLLSNLLEWSRLNRDTVKPSMQTFVLNNTVSQCVEVATEMSVEKSINIENQIDPTIEVESDPYLLQIVVNNLLTNAIKFTRNGGHVRLWSEQYAPDEIKISVSDNGIGMSEEMKNIVFEGNSKNNRIGTNGETSTGLGLILCKEFVERTNGKIWVESEEGKGSTFSFTMKLAEK